MPTKPRVSSDDMRRAVDRAKTIETDKNSRMTLRDLKRKWRGRRYDIIGEYDGVPIREARKDLRLIPNARDIQGAVRYHPQECVLARCATRVFGGVACIKGTTAYVQNLDEQGNRVIERFKLYGDNRRYTELFDKGRGATPKAITLAAPAPSHTVKAMTADRAKRKRVKARDARAAKSAEKYPDIVLSVPRESDKNLTEKGYRAASLKKLGRPSERATIPARPPRKESKTMFLRNSTGVVKLYTKAKP